MNDTMKRLGLVLLGVALTLPTFFLGNRDLSFVGYASIVTSMIGTVICWVWALSWYAIYMPRGSGRLEQIKGDLDALHATVSQEEEVRARLKASLEKAAEGDVNQSELDGLTEEWRTILKQRKMMAASLKNHSQPMKLFPFYLFH